MAKAKVAGGAKLRFVDHTAPGITRKALKRGERIAWAYFDPAGKCVTDRDEIDRLNRIALPPAYVDAWYATDGDAHLLATGIDARGRKQYRYNPAFRSQQESAKFDRCAAFGAALPAIRARVEKDLACRGLTCERAVASVVRLLDGGQIRVGNEAYAKENKSFGATTLRMRHAKVGHGQLKLRFRAKSGKDRTMTVTDKSLIRFVRTMQDLPGQHLFQYLDDDGAAVPVTSNDVNDYLKETTGEEFTAKNFRTWAASAMAYEALVEAGGDIPLKPLLLMVSERLGNTPAIARKSYVHPAVLAIATADEKPALEPLPRAARGLTRAERGLLAFLEAAPPAIELIAA